MTDPAASAAPTPASAPASAEPFAFDPGNEVHARALARLASERIAWLGTTSRNGFPHAVPVWFLWHEGEVVIWSRPDAAKVGNIRRDPRVVVHLESGHDEEQLTVLQGTAVLEPGAAASWIPRIGDAYLAKYEQDLPPLGLTFDAFAAQYSTVIRVTPVKLIAW